jgi:dihydrolipoamide dehydrogenase
MKNLSPEQNTLGETLNGETLLAPPPVLEDEEPALDPADIVEAAEELLREGAPHDFDVLVIGGGPGGYVAALRAAQLGAHVGLVEERELGGVCLNRGCIPTKTLLESVDVLRLLRRSREYGIAGGGEVHLDFAQMNRRKREVIEQLREHVAHLLAASSVEIVQGKARFIEEHTVEVSTQSGTRRISAVHIIIATGSLPIKLPVPGHDLPGVVTSDELLQSEVVPRDVVVAGGGAVGVEFAYLFREMGAQATIIEQTAGIMPQEDDDIGREMTRVLEDIGVRLQTESTLERIERSESGLEVVYSREGRESRLSTQCVLMATGRRAHTADLNMDAVGIRHDKGKIEVDENCETSVSGVYAIGDCIRNVGWAHLASGEGTMVAEIVTKNTPTIDLTHVPSCYYTQPEIASVGRTQEQAEADGLKVRVGKFEFRANGRAAAAGDHYGFVKVVVDDSTNRLLGCQIIGPRATDIISEAVLALKSGYTVDEMVGAIHAHPTFSEALPEAALAARTTDDHSATVI